MSSIQITLAVPSDAQAISNMSRDYVERGLAWSWTAARVMRSIRDRATNVAVVREGGRLVAFGIMRYGDRSAHLLLLAVHKPRRRKGVGAALLAWLEKVARTAGIDKIHAEARTENEAARGFYRSQHYEEVGTVAGYYQGVEDAVRLEKLLWAPVAGST